MRWSKFWLARPQTKSWQLSDSAADVLRNDPDGFFIAARHYALLSDALRNRRHSQDDNEKAEGLAEKAVQFIGQAMDCGFANSQREVESHPDLDSLRTRQDFQKLLGQLHLGRIYCAVWHQGEGDYELARPLYGSSPDEHLAACRELMAAGFRPQSVSVLNSGNARTQIAASVWLRPLVPSKKKIESMESRKCDSSSAATRGRSCRPGPLSGFHRSHAANRIDPPRDVRRDRCQRADSMAFQLH